MKKTPSPLIIHQGQIKKQSPRFKEEIVSTRTNTDAQKTYSAFNYIKATTKRVSGVFSALFSWKWRVKSKTNQTETEKRRGQVEEFSYSVDNSTRSTRKSSTRTRYSSSPRSSNGNVIQVGSVEVSLDEIREATGNFSATNKIGEGGFGTVYKGKLKDGSVVAIKRAKKDIYNQRLSAEFNNEILTLSNIEHQNLVRFLGYLEHGNERIVIVEYISNGNLREHLDGIRGDGLETAERLDIAIDVAHAVTYLHTYTDPPIIHRDIKASNILITERLRAKVADFGFARSAVENPEATHISTQVKGTAGYLDPEYLKSYQLTEKSDVYSFGVLLVEMMTKLALRKLKDGEAVIAMDPRLRRNQASNQAVEKVLKLARQCLAPSKQSRPSMKKCAEVLWQIRKELRERSLAHSASTSYHSADIIGRCRRRDGQDLYEIPESDYHRFHSA